MLGVLLESKGRCQGMLLSTLVIRTATHKEQAAEYQKCLGGGSLPYVTNSTFCLAQSKCVKRALHLGLFRNTLLPKSSTHCLTVLLLMGPQLAECHPPSLEGMSRASPPCIPPTAPPLGKGPSWPNVCPPPQEKMGVRELVTPVAIQPQTGVILQLGQHNLGPIPPHMYSNTKLLLSRTS